MTTNDQLKVSSLGEGSRRPWNFSHRYWNLESIKVLIEIIFSLILSNYSFEILLKIYILQKALTINFEK